MTRPSSDVGLSGGSPIPADLLRQVEDDTYCATCDWGYCNRPTWGFAWSESEPADEWLPICLACAKGDFPEVNDEPYPVDRTLSLTTIRDAL